MSKRLVLAALVALAAAAYSAAAQEKEMEGEKKVDCPAAVKAAVEKAYPEAKIVLCEEEKEEGKIEYAVEIETKDGRKIELDVTAEGKILATEEEIALSALPAAVAKAFQAKYPKAKPFEATRRTRAGGKVFYEVYFEIGEEEKEATFAEDGTFVEED